MTERRMTPDPGAAQDTQVSETYRDIAQESAPEHLNQAVLAAAAREARPKYSRLRLWTRPAAWAAVVMLSVAILMETSQDPATPSLEPAPEREDLYQPETAESDYNAVAEPKSAERQSLKSEASSADMQELRVQDEDLLEQAEEMARMREGTRDEPAPAVAARAVAAPREDAPACDETARAAPESWLECIVELEEAGALDAARLERELLAESFPDFDAR